MTITKLDILETLGEPVFDNMDGYENVLEWYRGERKITVFIEDRCPISYIKVWGKNIEDEMDDGYITKFSDINSLKTWIDGDN